jgi:histidinol phosphatase-like PHP family hydrolase
MRPDLPIPRRSFLGGAAAACTAATLSGFAAPASADDEPLGFPLVDLHVHLDNSTLEKVLALSVERHVTFGIVEHAGTRENKYPRVLSNDEELLGQIRALDGKGVYKGVQAEWTDWMSCFSPAVLAQLDYVLTDAMTFPGPGGRRIKLWEKEAESVLDMSNHEAFMDRFVDWHVEIMAGEPIDILANASWLPAPLEPEYDTLWTEKRVQKVIDAALKYGVAIEISSSYKKPRLPFLRQAKAAGVKFSFGSNGRYPAMGKLDYSVAMAHELKLKSSDMFTPAPDGKKAVQRRGKH